MLIFWDQRLVFLATPKTGSTAVEVALDSLASVTIQRPAPFKHMPAQDFQATLAPWLAAQAGAPFTTLALMREPVEWLRSWYRFRVEEAPEPTVAAQSFEAFARAYMETGGALRAEIGSQAAHLCGADGTPAVDRIFRYEEIDTFVQFLEDRLDCAITLPRVNVPAAADTAISPETLAALREALAADFALYDSLA
ncbi:hypothetical protein SAMN05877809_102208 [Rhodobacter sp. JA431]|uniref:hypothetical protein n=1 Tax=Rhodobacter sp. JA431 TaxID=570013 RepID=UPI000BD15F0A|nr:hypothetical protein [Rhodobacter sp. JA431]SOB98348.1 hypothetical protein SAMN05877809_102208 [Rhodobacter sp. JA431]